MKKINIQELTRLVECEPTSCVIIRTLSGTSKNTIGFKVESRLINTSDGVAYAEYPNRIIGWKDFIDSRNSFWAAITETENEAEQAKICTENGPEMFLKEVNAMKIFALTEYEFKGVVPSMAEGTYALFIERNY